MPYIVQRDRTFIDNEIDNLVKAIVDLTEKKPDTDLAGIVNYTISSILGELIIRKYEGKLRYWMVAIFSGVLSNVKDEFYRRLVGPYEDKCIEKNGDVTYYEYLHTKMEGKE